MAGERATPWHTPLPNPRAHIRLLSFSAEDAHFEDGEVIDCIMLTCVLSKAPPFAAISYTWGQPALTRHIMVNGHQVPVRENCYYALWQAQHEKQYYIWIDALCVDQDNLDEKTYQVAMMGKIYERASCVMVSLGPHVKESKFLADNLDGYKFIEHGIDWRSGFQSMESKLGSDHILQLMNAMVWLATHPYWTRVWIVQEFVVAREVNLRCGADVLDLETIFMYHMNLLLRHLYHDAAAELGARLELELASFTQDDKLSSSPMTILIPHRENLIRKRREQSWGGLVDCDRVSADLDLRKVLEFRGAGCLNPLDRVYGFTHLMKESKQAIVTDYRTLPFDLALQCLDRVRHDAVLWARRVLAALQIGSWQPEIRAILQVRQEIYLRAATDQDNEQLAEVNRLPWTATDQVIDIDTECLKNKRLREGFSMHFFDKAHFAKLQSTSAGRITGNLTTNRPELQDSVQFEEAAFARSSTFVKAWSDRASSKDGPRYVELFQDESLVGLLSSNAGVGDYVLQSEDEVLLNDMAFHVCIVVRPYLQTYFGIIGQGLVSSDWSFCSGGGDCRDRRFEIHPPSVRDPERSWYGHTSQPIAGFEVRLSKLDLVAFAAYDLTGEKLETRIHETVVHDRPLKPQGPWAPLQRLDTNITSERFSSYAVAHSSNAGWPVSPLVSEESSSIDSEDSRIRLGNLRGDEGLCKPYLADAKFETAVGVQASHQTRA